MATWVTHLIIADKLMKHFPKLDRRGFCVGNIAPDCNIENENWTSYTPPRELTHWMSGNKKSLSGSDRFCEEYIIRRSNEIKSNEQLSFLLGYYTHLITDAEFLTMIRDEQRVKAVWKRIKNDNRLSTLAADYPENWDSVKKIISKDDRMRELYFLEAEYLQNNPNSGYLTEIMPLKEFPDYIDYMPHGCIARKIRVMGYYPQKEINPLNLISISREEFNSFIQNTIQIIIDRFNRIGLNC